MTDLFPITIIFLKIKQPFHTAEVDIF